MFFAVAPTTMALSIIFAHLENVKSLMTSIGEKGFPEKWIERANKYAALATANLEQQAVDVEEYRSVGIVVPKELRFLQAIERSSELFRLSVIRAMALCIEENEVELVEMLLEEVNDAKDLRNCVSQAILLGKTEIVKLILQHDSTIVDGDALGMCAKYGHVELFKFLLNFTAPTRDNLIFIMSSKNVPMLEILAADGRVDLSVDDNKYLIEWTNRGSYPMLVALLKDPRVNPAARDNTPLLLAIQLCKSGSSPNVRNVEALLRTKRVVLGPCGPNRDPLELARSKGVPDVIRLLEEAYVAAGVPV